jgi:N-acetyl-gamma-glutamyl-phosphate reductase
MIRVAVVGATGYAGAELVRLLAGHPHIELTVLTSRQYAGHPFSGVYPALSGLVKLDCEDFDSRRVGDRADIVFTALPHRLPMDIVPALVGMGKRVIDLSADFRFRNAARYEAHYQPHTAKELLPRSVYGLTEVYGEEIRTAALVGNPGCYPTCILLPLVPLARGGLLNLQSLVADAKSGVSGAGRSPTQTTTYCAVSESFKAYKVAAHRHQPEMAAVLEREAGQPVALTFVPHLVPMSRGMAATIYATPAEGVEQDDIDRCLRDYFGERPFVRLRGSGQPPNTLDVRGTNFCDIGFVFDRPAHRLVLMSVIDNLVKGAAGQAVQNMNIMLGLPETAGLMQVPYPL